MEQTYKKTIQLLTGFSTALLLCVLLFYTSYQNPIVFEKYSIRYLLVVVVITVGYVSSIWLLLRTPFLRKRGLQDGLIFLLTLIIMLLVGEIVFHLMDGFGFVRSSEYPLYRKQPHARYTFCGSPSNRKEFCAWHENNSLGFNDNEYILDKPAGTYRIVVLGDSFVEAHQVELEDTFHKIMEARLKEKELRTEVIALGRGGQGQVVELQYLEKEGLKYGPDLVIMEFLASNDIRDNFPKLYGPDNQEKIKALIPSRLKRLLFGRFDFAFFAADTIDHIYGSTREPIPSFLQVYEPRRLASDLEWQKAWNITFDTILRTKKVAEENGSDFLLVSFTSQREILSYENRNKAIELIHEEFPATSALPDSHYDFQMPDRLMADFAQQNGIHYLQLNPIFAKMRGQDGSDLQFHFYYDGHWNERGHQAAAQAILEYLDSNFLYAMR